MKLIFNILLVLLSGLYLLNLGLGFVELIPDNIPFFGNLDEGLAGIIFWTSLRNIFGSKSGKQN